SPRAGGALARLRAAFGGDGPARLELAAARQYSDAVADLAFAAPRLRDFDLPVGLPGLRTSALSADVYRPEGVELGAERRGEAGFLRLDGYWRDLDYLRGDGLDQRARGLTLGLARELRPGLSLGAFAAADWRDYRIDARSDREDSVGLSLRW